MLSALLRCFVFGLIASASSQAAGTDWMTSLDGKTPLSRLTLPGTHDAGALYEPLPGTTKCQTLSITAQLEAGVRFLDIRCRHVKDRFAIYHGMVDQKQTFDEVVETVAAFLKAHPGETVVLSAKEEYKPEGNTRSFEATFQEYLAKDPGLWRLDPTLPKLDEARGRIVLFRRFRSGSIGGIDASVWPDSTTFSSGLLRVQDAYQVTGNDSKWDSISKLLAETSDGDPQTLFVNFTSGTTNRTGIPNIPTISNDINVRLSDYLSAHPSGCCGILVMDFVTPEACEKVYRTNLPPAGK